MRHTHPLPTRVLTHQIVNARFYASCPGGPPPPHYIAATPTAAAAAAADVLLRCLSLLLHQLNSAPSAAVDLLSEENQYDASYPMAASSHLTAAAAIFIPGLIMTHKRGECRRQWRSSGPTSLKVFTGRYVRAEPWPQRQQQLPGARIRLEFPPYTHNDVAEAFTTHLLKDHDKQGVEDSDRREQQVSKGQRA